MQITQELIVQVICWPDISLPARPGSMFSAQFYEYFKFTLLVVSVAYLQIQNANILAVKKYAIPKPVQ